MLVKEVLERTTEFFKNKKIETARLDAELILAQGLGWRRIDLYLKFDLPLRPDELDRLRPLVTRRGNGEPLAYIFKEKEFFRHNFYVDERVLIPRPESEIIVERAIAWAQAQQKENIEVLDLGAGSGCLGLSVIAHLPQARLTSVDISADALDVLTINAKRLGLEARVSIVHENAEGLNFLSSATSSPKKFDIVLANPPYISEEDTLLDPQVKKFEPHLALFADDEGFAAVSSWSKEAVKVLARPSIALFEIGHNHGPKSREHFLNLGFFDEVEILKDYSGLNRIVEAKTHG